MVQKLRNFGHRGKQINNVLSLILIWDVLNHRSFEQQVLLVVIHPLKHLGDKVCKVVMLPILRLNSGIFLSLKDVRDTDHKVLIVPLV